MNPIPKLRKPPTASTKQKGFRKCHSQTILLRRSNHSLPIMLWYICVSVIISLVFPPLVNFQVISDLTKRFVGFFLVRHIVYVVRWIWRIGGTGPRSSFVLSPIEGWITTVSAPLNWTVSGQNQMSFNCMQWSVDLGHFSERLWRMISLLSLIHIHRVDICVIRGWVNKMASGRSPFVD